jgi:hypothetical protein
LNLQIAFEFAAHLPHPCGPLKDAGETRAGSSRVRAAALSLAMPITSRDRRFGQVYLNAVGFSPIVLATSGIGDWAPCTIGIRRNEDRVDAVFITLPGVVILLEVRISVDQVEQLDAGFNEGFEPGSIDLREAREQWCFWQHPGGKCASRGIGLGGFRPMGSGSLDALL